MKSTAEELKEIVNKVMALNHVGIQCDNIHNCEEKHQVILSLDKLDKHEAIRLLMHVIHVQQLQLAGATVILDPENPFLDMSKFEYIAEYVQKSNSPNQTSLY